MPVLGVAVLEEVKQEKPGYFQSSADKKTPTHPSHSASLELSWAQQERSFT